MQLKERAKRRRRSRLCDITEEGWANVEKYHWIAREIACRVLTHWRSIDERAWYATWGIIAAAAAYDPTKGRTFMSFAWWQAKGAIINGYKLEQRRLRHEVQMPESEDGVPLLADMGDDRYLGYRDVEQAEFWADVTATVGARDGAFLEMAYRLDMGVREIGRAIGMSHNNVGKRMKRAVHELAHASCMYQHAADLGC